MRVTSLGSGSSGNALLVEAGPRGRTKLLVDAGFSSRIICDRLRQLALAVPRDARDAENLAGIEVEIDLLQGKHAAIVDARHSLQ